MKILILGVGNTLMADDGVGVRAVELLSERYRFPDEVRVVDGGTLGLDLLPQLEGVERLLLIDAVDSGAAPGTMARLSGDEIPAAMGGKLSPHQLGLKDLLAVASLLGTAPKETVLWGVQPASIEMSLELSQPVQAQLVPLVKKVLQELRCWGVSPFPSCSRHHFDSSFPAISRPT